MVFCITLSETRTDTDTGTMKKMETRVLFGNISADQRQGQEQDLIVRYCPGLGLCTIPGGAFVLCD